MPARPRSLRFAGHPIHPMLSDFPLAFWAGSIVWDALALGTGNPVWWAVAFWCIALGTLAAVPTAVAGFVDFTGIDDDRKAAVATTHLTLMLSAATCYGASLWLRGGPAPCSGGQWYGALAASLTGLGLLCVGGWFGGHLVFHYGIGSDIASTLDRK